MSLLHDLAATALRRLDPETAHRITLDGLKAGLGPRDPGPDDPALATVVAGLALPNCVGLAAGFDKDAEVPDAALAMGFGLIECGGVTPLPQPGNPRPRLFRLTEDGAVINRLGLNSAGVEVFAERLGRRRGRGGVVGVNLGANKESADRIGDYVTLIERLWGLVDYFTVNVSSPNTPGLRNLQGRAALDELAGRVATARAGLRAGGRDTPFFLKIAPDLADDDIPDIVAAVRAHGFDGLIVSNTTIARPESLRSPSRGETGGLSGAPLMGPSTRMLRLVYEAAPDLALIGVGGIASGADAYAKIRAGAHALQFYTAMALHGPGLVGRIKRELAALLRADGFASVTEARGKG